MKVEGIVERSPEWHAHRLLHVNASEVACFWGVQPEYAPSMFSLWQQKAGNIPVGEVEGERLAWGIRLEPVVAQAIREVEGWGVEKGVRFVDEKVSVVIDGVAHGAAASLEYVIEEPGPVEWRQGWTGPGVLQIKCVDRLAYKRAWAHDQPPQHIQMQVQHEAMCAGFAWGAVAVLIGGNELKVIRLAARPRIHSLIRDKVKEFWRSVRDNKPPLIDGTMSTTDALRELFPHVEDTEHDPVDLTFHNELAEVCFGYETAQADVKEGKRRLEEFRNRMRAIIRDKSCVIAQGYRIDTTIVDAKKPRLALPGEVIGGRRESRRYTVRPWDSEQFLGGQDGEDNDES